MLGIDAQNYERKFDDDKINVQSAKAFAAARLSKSQELQGVAPMHQGQDESTFEKLQDLLRSLLQADADADSKDPLRYVDTKQLVLLLLFVAIAHFLYLLYLTTQIMVGQ